MRCVLALVLSLSTQAAPVEAHTIFSVALTLKCGECGELPDKTSLCLGGFTHKRPYAGGATQTSAQLELKRNGSVLPLRLSRNGVDGQPASADTFSSLFVADYELQLTAFDYDASVSVTVTKFHSVHGRYDAPFTLSPGVVVRFDDSFAIRLGALNPKFVDLEVLLDQGSKLSTRLYENGTPASEGQWVGPKGSTISGRRIQLRGTLAGPSVQLEVKAP